MEPLFCPNKGVHLRYAIETNFKDGKYLNRAIGLVDHRA